MWSPFFIEVELFLWGLVVVDNNNLPGLHSLGQVHTILHKFRHTKIDDLVTNKVGI